MLSDYQPTSNDLFISKLYHALGILNPYQIDIQLIATTCGSKIAYYPGRSFSYRAKNESFIILNNQLTTNEQRADFFHELGHILLHEGDQDHLSPLFIQLQEWQANRFQLAAAMPYHLLPEIKNLRINEYARVLSELFSVPLDVAYRRIDHIRSRIPLKLQYA